jgi:NAD(P)-dependent dehydrogenase (short-subunit alcohol dehydrogenase family)
MVSIQGSTVLVTGGQRGLGMAIVDELLQRGAAKVYATARAPQPSLSFRLCLIRSGVPAGRQWFSDWSGVLPKSVSLLVSESVRSGRY